MNTESPYYLCRSCHMLVPHDDVVVPSDGKVLGCVAGLSIGAASKNVWAAVGLTVAGAVLGHIIDQHITPYCPTCGAVLKLLARAHT